MAAPLRVHTLDEKVHPALHRYLGPGAPGTRIRVIVSFRDTLTLPDFPEEPDTLGRGAPHDTTFRFGTVRARGPAELEPLFTQRAADYQALLDTLSTRYRADHEAPLWLIRAIAADVPAREIQRIAAWNQVIYIEPAHSGEPPPQGDSSGARTATGANPLIEEGYDHGLVALLDTGVRSTHTLLQGTGNLRYKRDCVDGDLSCAGPTASPGEACPASDGHGTGSAALLTGNSNLGDQYRGLTDVRIDSYRVYDRITMEGMCGAELNPEATSEAVMVALTSGARVILVQSQGTGSRYSAISLNADAAFSRGAVVMAPVGNYGAGSVGTPANARGALAVGAYDLTTGDWYSGQSYGPTSDDGRTKPEVVAPTGCKTASAQSNVALTTLSKTSGAAPVGTGVAVLLRNLLRGAATKIDPGFVYAALIAATDTTAGHYEIEKHGAGRLEVPEAGDFWRDKTDLSDGEIAEWELTDLDATSLSVGVWWADPLMFDASGYALDTHNDVNLELVKVQDSEEHVVSESSRGAGIFERAASRITGKRGVRWRIRLTGHAIGATPQRVYWVAIAKR